MKLLRPYKSIANVLKNIIVRLSILHTKSVKLQNYLNYQGQNLVKSPPAFVMTISASYMNKVQSSKFIKRLHFVGLHYREEDRKVRVQSMSLSLSFPCYSFPSFPKL